MLRSIAQASGEGKVNFVVGYFHCLLCKSLLVLIEREGC
jgi:hypothetical protein